MNFELIGQLVRLRYKLLWAKTRTRNGKIALFLAGYLLLVPLVALLAAGGFGAGMIAVRSGKAERIAQGIVTGLFAWALLTSVMLGFGMNAIFADAELRRYPLKARERRVARHFTGIADPYWFLFLALYLGLAFGLYVCGAGSFLPALVAVLLLYICNYLAAQVVGLLLEQLTARKGGSIALPVLLMALCFLPSLAAPALQKNPAAFQPVLRALSFTPTFGAGSLMTRTDAQALFGFALLAVWIAGLTVALAALERHPPKVRAAQSSRIRFDTPFLRAGVLFGPRCAPLVAHWLQFFARCKRFRLQYLITLPTIPFFLFVWAKQSHHGDPFPSAISVFAISTFAPVAAVMVNQFGYTGGGFRRYFLFPVDPGMALRTSSYALLALGSVLLVETTLLWMLFGPAPLDPRGTAMLVAAGLFGMFLFHGAGLWTTLYGARRSDPQQTMGNDLSLAGNVMMIGGMLAMLFGPRAAAEIWKGSISPDHWWAAVILAAVAAWFYFASLRHAAARLSSRREALLAMVEGKA
jgi:hypothetical protein